MVPSANPGSFTTVAVDNIHNKSLITAKDSLHCTTIAIFQHFLSITLQIRHNFMLLKICISLLFFGTLTNILCANIAVRIIDIT